MWFSYVFLYTFLAFFCSISHTFCGGEGKDPLSHEELLNKHSRLFSLPPFPINKFIEEQRHHFQDNLKDATEPRAMDGLSEPDKQQLCWKCLLYMKKLYKDGEKTKEYAYAYFNMARFLLDTGTYPDNAFKRKKSINKSKLFHSTLITKIAKIVKRSGAGRKDKIYKWGRIDLALLSMEYAGKHERKQSSKAKQIEKSYRALLEAKEAETTKTVNFYLAKLILDPKFHYIPTGLDQQGAYELAYQYLSAMSEVGERQRPRVSGAASRNGGEELPLYPVKSAQPAYLHRGRPAADRSSLSAALASMGLAIEEDNPAQHEEGKQEELEYPAVTPSIAVLSSIDPVIKMEDDSLVVLERKQDESAHPAAPPPSSALVSSASSMRVGDMPEEQEYDPGLSAASLPGGALVSSIIREDAEDEGEDESSSGSSSGDDSSSSSEDDSNLSDEEGDLSPVEEGKVLVGESLPVSLALQKAYDEAMKSEAFTETLKNELKERYLNTKESKSRSKSLSLDEVRLVLFLNKDRGLSYTKISEHIFFKGKITDGGIRRIVVAHGEAQPEILKEAYDEAMKSETFTETLKNRLKERYSNAKKSHNKSKVSLDEVRLILFLKKDRDLSHAKIAKHIFLKGKIKEMAIGYIIHANGVAKRSKPEAVTVLTGKRKQDIFTAYLSISAQGKEQKKELSRRQIAIAIASHLQCAEKEIITQLNHLVNPKTKSKRYNDAPSISQKQTVLEQYKAGSDFSEIQEVTKLSFSAITGVIIAEIPPKELTVQLEIALPETSVDRAKKIVALYNALTTPEKGPPSISLIAEQTGHSHKICRQALEAKGLVKKKQSAERLEDEGKKEQIREYWQTNLERWERGNVLFRNRYQDVAQYFTKNHFKVTPAQVQGLCHNTKKRKREAVRSQHSKGSHKGFQEKKPKVIIDGE